MSAAAENTVLAVVALLTAIGTVIAVVWRRGEQDGRIATVLEQLTKISADHETRIRDLEHR